MPGGEGAGARRETCVMGKMLYKKWHGGPPGHDVIR